MNLLGKQQQQYGYIAPAAAKERIRIVFDNSGSMFDRTKVNFQDAFKYLSPNLRLALSDGNFRADLQNGKVR